MALWEASFVLAEWISRQKGGLKPCVAFQERFGRVAAGRVQMKVEELLNNEIGTEMLLDFLVWTCSRWCCFNVFQELRQNGSLAFDPAQLGDPNSSGLGEEGWETEDAAEAKLELVLEMQRIYRYQKD